jgi:hypothetical protein
LPGKKTEGSLLIFKSTPPSCSAQCCVTPSAFQQQGAGILYELQQREILTRLF